SPTSLVLAPTLTPPASATPAPSVSQTVSAVPTTTTSSSAAIHLAAPALPSATPSPVPAPTGYPGQSNLVPPGFPTPTTAYARLTPGGPPRDPGSLTWAQPGPYIAPRWTDFTLHSFGATQRLATTYYFYWH